MGVVTPETCRVTLQYINICILLHLVGFLLTLNYDARNHELKKMEVTCYVEMMVPLPIFSRCRKLEDHKHTNNLGPRRSVVIRLMPPSHYLCRKWPHY